MTARRPMSDPTDRVNVGNKLGKKTKGTKIITKIKQSLDSNHAPPPLPNNKTNPSKGKNEYHRYQLLPNQ